MSLGESSWPGEFSASYNEETLDVDRFVWDQKQFLPLFSAGNSGQSGYGTVGSPGISKNTLTIGAGANHIPWIPVKFVLEYPQGTPAEERIALAKVSHLYSNTSSSFSVHCPSTHSLLLLPYLLLPFLVYVSL